MAPATEGGSNGNGPVWRTPGSAARALAGRYRVSAPANPQTSEGTPRQPSLQRMLQRGGTAPLAPALLVLDDLLESLGRLHAAGITHGHVRPESVLVGPDGRCRLDDRAARPALGSASLGLLGYVAPEVRAGGARSPSSDIYGATAVFFEALTGLPPLGGVDQARRDETVPLPARRLVEEGLDADPTHRTSSSERMRSDLATAGDAFLDRGWRQSGRSWLTTASDAVAPAAAVSDAPIAPVTKRSRSWSGRAAKPAADKPAAETPADADAGPVAPVVAADNGGGGLLAGLRHRDPDDGDEPRRRDPRLLAGIAIVAIGLLALIIVAAFALRGTPARTTAPIVTGGPASSAPSLLPTPSGPVFGTSSTPATPASAPTPSPSPSPSPTPAPTARPPAGGNNPPPSFVPLPAPTPTQSCLIIICI
ncbi:MAG TPA: hypothetical protein VF155_10265 [Candidatus Dormibacteraeota bacterium]